MKNRPFITALALALAGVSYGAGPLYIHDADNQVPHAYQGGVQVYTDLADLGGMSNEQADDSLAFGVAQWSAVPTSSFAATVVGDFATIGLVDITGANAHDVIDTDNGRGIHVIYDNDGSAIGWAYPGIDDVETM